MPVHPTPEQYQPRLRWWSHAWRMALSLSLSAVVWSQAWSGQWHGHRALFWIDAVLGVASYVLVMFRRRWPFPIALATAALSTVSGVAAGPAALAAVSLATRRQMVSIVVIGLANVLTAQAYADTQPVQQESPLWVDFLLNVAVTAGMLGWGMYIGSRRELLWTLRDRADRAEAEQVLRVGNARNQERARIAREMHDVLAHRISQVSMHAGALSFRDDLSPDEIRASAGVIRDKANEALNDLRAVLGVLRDPDGELVHRPQPTYDEIPELIGEARESGMNIEFTDLLASGSAIPLTVGRTLYRIIQEGLTNARKHAPGALVRIQLSGSQEDGIDLLLRNAVGFAQGPSIPGAGLGLIGLSERAQLRGGRLVHRKDGSTFVLHGWLPWAA